MNKRSGIESRKKIFNSATKVFSEYGYAKASMRMIAKEAGISIGGLYLYFKNKDELYFTLIKSRFEEITRLTTEALRGINDPSEALKEFISIRLSYAKKNKELIMVQGREHGFTFGIQMKKKFFRNQRTMIEEIIKRGIKTGVFHRCNVTEAAKIIHSAIRGFVLSMVVESYALFSSEECSRLVLNGLLRRDHQ